MKPFVTNIKNKKMVTIMFVAITNAKGIFGNCFFSLFFVSNFFFLFFKLKNLFGNPKWTKNKNCSQNSIWEENWKHAKCCFQFLIFKSQWKHVFNLMNLSHLMSCIRVLILGIKYFSIFYFFLQKPIFLISTNQTCFWFQKYKKIVFSLYSQKQVFKIENKNW